MPATKTRRPKANLRVIEGGQRKPQALIHGLDDQFLQCRDLKHAWQVQGYYRGTGGLVCRRLTCRDCGTTAVDHWTAKGGREPRRYSYPEGYELSGVGQSPSGDLVRREVLGRVKVYANEDQMTASLFAPRARRRQA